MMADFVLDASAAMVLVLDDEPEEPVMAIVGALASGAAIVPGLWRFEVASALATSFRRGRVDEARLARATELIEGMNPVQDDDPMAVGALLAFARLHAITPYDAAYLALALRRGIALASIDGDLREAAQAAQVTLVG